MLSPNPLNAATSVLSLVETTSFALAAPTRWGANVTEIGQLLPATSSPHPLAHVNAGEPVSTRAMRRSEPLETVTVRVLDLLWHAAEVNGVGAQGGCRGTTGLSSPPAHTVKTAASAAPARSSRTPRAASDRRLVLRAKKRSLDAWIGAIRLVVRELEPACGPRATRRAARCAASSSSIAALGMPAVRSAPHEAVPRVPTE